MSVVNESNGCSAPNIDDAEKVVTKGKGRVEYDGGGEGGSGSVVEEGESNKIEQDQGRRDISRSGKSAPKSGNGLDLGEIDTSKAKRQKMSENMALPVPDLPPNIQSSKQQGSPLSKTGNSAQNVSEVQYATDSATAMKNIQRWTSIPSSAAFTQSSDTTVSEVETSVDIPSHAQPPVAVIQQYAQLTPDDIIQGHVTANDIMQGHVTANDIIQDHVTAEEIIARYRLSPEKLANSAKCQETTNPTGSQVENAQSVFSSGNFSKQVPLSTPTSNTKNSTSEPASCDSHMSKLHGINPTTIQSEENCDPINVPSHIPKTTFGVPSSSETFDGTTMPSMDFRRLIPHLEALADLLQNPTSLETQYLAALAAKAQLFPQSLTVGGPNASSTGQDLPNNLEALAAIAAHVGHIDSSSTDKSLPSAFEALAAIASQNLTSKGLTDEKPHFSSFDLSNLLSNTDFTKLLPTLAALEVRGGLGYGQENPNLKPVPITDPNAVKRLWDEMLFVESNPGYVGGSSIGEMGASVGGVGGLVDGVNLPGEYADEKSPRHQTGGEGGGHLPKRSHSLTNNSFLLDGNFQIDIPPPGELATGESTRNQVSI